MKRFALAILIIAIVPLVLLAGTDKKPLTPRDIVSLDSVTQPQISPDGKQAAYVRMKVDLSTSTNARSIWLANLEDGSARQFTREGGNDYAPRWNPAGGEIAFLSSSRPYYDASGEEHRGRQLWLISTTGGEAHQLTALEEGVSDFRWSPDGTKIYLLSTEGRSEEAEKKYQAKKKRRDDGYVVDAELFRDQFYVLNLASGETKKLSDGHAGIDGFEVSPDGSKLVYATNYTGVMDDDLKFDLWLVDTQSGEQTQLTDFPGPETSPSWSPDGKYVAYLSTTEPDIEYAQPDVTVIEASPGMKPAVLTLMYDRAALNTDWAADGWIYFVAAEGAMSPLMRVRPGSDVEAVPYDGYNVSSFSTDAKADRFLSRADKYPGLPEVMLLDRGTSAVKPVTNMSSQLENFLLPDQKVISYENEGQKLEAILLTPATYKKGDAPLPLVLEYHGGPYGRRTNTFRESWQAFAGAGYAVVAPNYRGGEGYGDAFGKSLRNDFGGVDYRDSIAAVDAVIKMGIADPDKLVVTGGSWGGYLTNWTISQTNRFKAAVSLFGIFSFYTDMSNSVQPGFEKMYFGGNYWEGNPRYIERAPQTYVTKITTPVLIMHGEVDTLTFIANSNELYTALRMLGKTVQYVKYPREGHGFREPNHRIDYLRRSIEWFNKYIGKTD